MPPLSRPHPIVVFLATSSATVVTFLATVILATLAILTGWIPPRGNFMFHLSRVWSRCLLLGFWVRLEPRFEVSLDPGQSYVYLANHQSYLDIPAVLASIPNQTRFAAKRSLFRIPFFGWAITVGGFIPIDRGDRSKAREAFAQAASRLVKGTSVLFFPEGTRTFDGSLGPFERGGVLLALKSGLPIVPVGIRGARRVLPRGRNTIWPGPVEVRYGTPIETRDLGIRDRGALSAKVRSEVARLAGIDPSAPAKRDGTG